MARQWTWWCLTGPVPRHIGTASYPSPRPGKTRGHTHALPSAPPSLRLPTPLAASCATWAAAPETGDGQGVLDLREGEDSGGVRVRWQARVVHVVVDGVLVEHGTVVVVGVTCYTHTHTRTHMGCTNRDRATRYGHQITHTRLLARCTHGEIAVGYRNYHSHELYSQGNSNRIQQASTNTQ